MNTIDADWLEELNDAMRSLFALKAQDPELDLRLLISYYDLEPREAAVAIGNDYDLDRSEAIWPPAGLVWNS